MSDLQILGIPTDQLPYNCNNIDEFIENVTKLRLSQVFGAS